MDANTVSSLLFVGYAMVAAAVFVGLVLYFLELMPHKCKWDYSRYGRRCAKCGKGQQHGTYAEEANKLRRQAQEEK